MRWNDWKRMVPRAMRRTTLLAGFVLAAAAATAKPPSDAWLTQVSPALARAEATSRPVLVMLSAEWCAPCNVMKQDVFPAQNVQQALQRFVPVYIDGDTNTGEARKFDYNAYPTFIVLDSRGEELARMRGGVPEPAAFTDILNDFHGFARQVIALRREIERNPRDPALHMRMGELLYNRGNMDMALEAFRRAAELDSAGRTAAAGYVEFIEAFRATTRNPQEGDERLRAFRQRYATHPMAEDALFVRALIPLNSNDAQAARTLLQQYARQYPGGKFIDRVRRELEQL